MSDLPEYIGEATMQDDGTIVMNLLATEGPIRGLGSVTVKPTDSNYQETLDHIGGLEPGETKPVRPWPDDEE